MKKDYHSPTPNSITILAFGAAPDALTNAMSKKIITKEAYFSNIDQICKKVEECGFNCIIGHSSDMCENILNAITKRKYNLGVILKLSVITYTPSGTLLRIKEFLIGKKDWDKTLIKGWYIYDEPKYYMWGDATYEKSGENISMQDWDMLSTGYEICSELTPDLLSYWNLAVPNDTSDNSRDTIGDYENYEQYLEVLRILFKPSMWSYDVYPIIQYKDNPEINILHKHFYNSLRMFAHQYSSYGTVFWATAMTFEHDSYDKYTVNNGENKDIVYYLNHRRPMPTLGTLRFEIFSALACGAQGIVFYRVGASPLLPEYTPQKEGSYTTRAAISYKNNELIYDTELITLFKKINAEVRQFNDVFLGATPIDILHAGHGYNDGLKVSSVLAPFFTITVYKEDGTPVTDKNASDWEGVLMTSLKMKNKTFVVIVSHNPYGAQQIKLTFADSIYVIRSSSYYSENWIPVPTISIENDPHILPPNSHAKSGFYLLSPGGYLIIDTTP
ncbi:MAG: hypothetical protein HDS16_00530 [Bacteroides sp.]|nr:hypothetical protein [Bacteroidales bacterium]MBD5301480.1 hypothetical protein [Bacteroides sp.]MBD5349031.1 hypothetical protein [Bacteroides sp.]